MSVFVTDELSKLQGELQDIAAVSENQLVMAEHSSAAIQKYLLRLKEFILPYEFVDKDEEIGFFKHLKPAFQRQLIYFNELFYLEANKPVGDKETQMAYYRQAIGRVNTFFDRNQQLYIYYKAGRTNQDMEFFTRDANSPPLPDYALDIDPKFSTPVSSKLSEIQAFELLNDHIVASMHALENTIFKSQDSDVSQLSLSWTDKKAGLIEILYGIQSMGSLNNAKAELKQIARLFETAFDVDLGNYSRAFQEMRIRKKGRTAFLDRMKEMLIKRMDQADEYF